MLLLFYFSYGIYTAQEIYAHALYYLFPTIIINREEKRKQVQKNL